MKRDQDPKDVAAEQAQESAAAEQVQESAVAEQAHESAVAEQAQESAGAEQAQKSAAAEQAQKSAVAEQAQESAVAEQAQKSAVAEQAQKQAYRDVRAELNGVAPTYQSVTARTPQSTSLRGVGVLAFAVVAAAIAIGVLLVPDDPAPEPPEIAATTTELPTDVQDSLAFAEWEAPTDFLLEHDALDPTEPPEFFDAFEELEQLKEL